MKILKNVVRTMILAMAVVCAVPEAQARMTDDQVVAYIKKQTAAGKSEKQIGQELLAKGVTQEQVNRIKLRYNSSTAGSEAVDKSNASSIRTRSQSTAPTGTTGVQRKGGYPYNPSDPKSPNYTGTADVQYYYDPTDGLWYEQEGLELQADELINDQSSKRTIFGHDVFTNSALSFEPNENLATPQNYVLGPGDEVIIDIWGTSEDHIREVISPEGSIMVEQLGPVYLNGLTIQQANDHVRSTFANKYAGVAGDDTDINVTLGQVRTIQINVMGEVTMPGTFRLSPFATVFNALYRAGGINDIGSMRNIQVLRNGRNLVGVDVYEYLFNGKQTGNIRLQEGDVVIVPPYEQLINAGGNVKRPMYYEIKPGETLADLLNYAGGFAGDAYTDQVRLERQTGRENELFNVRSGDFDTYVLKDGDVVTVGTVLDRYSNRVEVQGAVFRPGMYALNSGLQTVGDLLKQADGLTEDAFLSRAILLREGADLALEVIPVDLGGIMSGKVADITLKRNDVLQVPSALEMQDRGPVMVAGLVAFPGEYPYADNMTIEDLVVRAGGLLRGASTARVDVSRRIVDPNTLEPSSQVAEVMTFSLKDGLVVDGNPNFTLQPYDMIEIRKSPVYNPQRRVNVEGEVVFEGGYTLQSKNERLSELVKRAGGLTDEAYVRGAHLLRKMSEDEKAARDESMRLALASSGNDSISVEKMQLGDTFSVGIDLEKALANPGSDLDLVLMDGDQLVIPELINTVRISGDVIYPNTVVYQKGMKLSHYIEQAGGYGTTANKNKAFIVYMNGTVARAKKNTPVEPGCNIIVPSKPQKAPFDWSKVVALSTSLGTLGTMAAAVANLLKK